MDENVEILDISYDDLVSKSFVETINIDDVDIEIIEIDDSVLENVSVIKTNVKNSFIDKIRTRLSKNKIAIISTCCALVAVTLTGVFILSNNTDKKLSTDETSFVLSSINEDVDFSLNEVDYNTILVNDEYEEKGASLFINGVDVSSDITIDSSNLDTSKIGTYNIVYTYSSGKNQVYTFYRTINVIDNEPPVINLNGSLVYTMLVNDVYNESGFFVSDNYDDDLLSDVVITNNIDTSTVGTYYVKYSVKDKSGNYTETYRTVKVLDTYYNNSNTVLSNKFTNNGLYLSGCVLNNSFKYKFLIKNLENGEINIVDVNKLSNHYYDLNLDISSYSNGTYEFYLVNDDIELLTNNMNNYNRIVRSRVGNKLVTMDYSKNNVKMIISDFEYLYDVVIDPGHGGSDTGAKNGKYVEKNINLEQSLYEKERYEQHGLKVLLLRDDDTYGITMGESNWEPLDGKGYAVGYYGVVSKIVYSNHHNSSFNNTSAGWEILVPAGISTDLLDVEKKVASIWSDMYIEPTNPYYRFYTKDYENAECHNKINGEVYNFEDFYAVIRIPNKLFNVKNVIYEGAYVNNNNDMRWYYDSMNWKKLSEVKIKAYVESIGVTYIEP